MSKPFLTVKDVRARLNCATSTLYRWLEKDIFPQPIRIGGMVRWKEEDLETFIREADMKREKRGPRPSGIRRGRPVDLYKKPKPRPKT